MTSNSFYVLKELYKPIIGKPKLIGTWYLRTREEAEERKVTREHVIANLGCLHKLKFTIEKVGFYYG